MPITREQELWGVAIWVEKHHGANGRAFIASQIERLAAEGDSGGIAMWESVAERLHALSEDGSPPQ